MWRPFEDKYIDECIGNFRGEGNCVDTACSQTQPPNPSEPKVISVCSKFGKCCTRCANISLPLVEYKFSLTSRHEPEPYVRNTRKNDDHDATAETPTTAPGADEDYDEPDDKHEYMNTKTDYNAESKKSH